MPSVMMGQVRKMESGRGGSESESLQEAARAGRSLHLGFPQFPAPGKKVSPKLPAIQDQGSLTISFT